jgi:predicted secreted protein
MRCIFCGSPDFKVLGNLGNRRHYRCNLCGFEMNEILNKIIDISKASEDIKEKIEESFKEIHSDFEKNFAEIKNSKSVYYIMFHGSSGLNLLISKDIALFR